MNRGIEGQMEGRSGEREGWMERGMNRGTGGQMEEGRGGEDGGRVDGGTYG